MRSRTGRATTRDDDDGCAVCQQRHRQKYDRSHQQREKRVVRAIARNQSADRLVARVVRDPSENRRLLQGDPGAEIHVCWLEAVFARAEEHNQKCSSQDQKKHRRLIGESHHGRGRELNATQVRHRRAKNSISISGELKRKLKTTHARNLLSALILVLVYVRYERYTLGPCGVSTAHLNPPRIL